MTNLFEKELLNEIDNATGADNSTSVDFDFFKFSQYLVDIQREMKAAGLVPLGFRIWFGKYPPDFVDVEKQNKLTVLFSITIAESGNILTEASDYIYSVANFGNNGVPPRKTFPDLNIK